MRPPQRNIACSRHRSSEIFGTTWLDRFDRLCVVYIVAGLVIFVDWLVILWQQVVSYIEFKFIVVFFIIISSRAD